ncbi:MAG: AAA family ATPase [Deltaproteobacteria bacterium]|nr:AAA family ATPase [Deltaproteobacteria bacterium]
MKTRRSKQDKRLRLQARQLRRRVSPRSLPSSSAYSRHRTHIIGQDRAIAAIEMGLRLESPGYNIFVSGPSGSGRMTTARHILEGFKHPRQPLADFVYVHNFQEPDRPRLLILEAGQGQKLKKAMEELIKAIKRELPRATSTEHCQKERDRVLAEYQRKEHDLVSVFQDKVHHAKFMAVEVQSGPVVEHDVLPVIDGEPQPLAVLEERVENGKMSRRQFKQLQKKHSQLRTELEKIQRRTRTLARDMANQLEEIDRRTGTAVIDALVEDIHLSFADEKVRDFLDEVREALLERIPALVQRDEDSSESQPQAPFLVMDAPDPLDPFQVNIILNNARRKGCPVVFEHSPTMVRLFGTIERSVDETGRPEIDFMNIRAGAMLRANGGFLVVQAEDLLPEPGVWKTLKSTLSTGQLEIRMPEGPMAMVTSALKPDPIPLDVKIIMLGDEMAYRALYIAEDDFKKTFKIKAEFDVEMDFSPSNIEKFMAFVQRVVSEEDLLQPVRAAVALLVEEAMRDVEDREKITTRFRVIADLLREAAFWARKASHSRIQPGDVHRAVTERRRRFNLAEEKYRENIVRDVVMVDTQGERIGQVNGLAVFDLGDYCFGKPCRITASVGIGEHGVCNIEREAGLSGEIHDKGIYILSGFLRNRFGQRQPLALDAGVCFEQSYGEVDGDSASSAEVYAILSALSGLPIRQGIAVTGSVNQQGDIQPIGGVNHKIEGFFDICRSRRLTGRQGVIIPRGNLEHLMLDLEVVRAVQAGRFHIWAVDDVDAGMELLTGVQSGKASSRGIYPQGTVNRLVADRLAAMASTLREYR